MVSNLCVCFPRYITFVTIVICVGFSFDFAMSCYDVFLQFEIHFCIWHRCKMEGGAHVSEIHCNL